MNNLASTITRIRQLLDDAEGDRFGDELLENAIRITLSGIDEKLPRVTAVEHTLVTTGRDQTLTGLTRPLYLIEVKRVTDPSSESEEALLTEYAYTLGASEAALHFSGNTVPQAGEKLRLKYASQNTLSGLDDEATTTLPDPAAVALELGSAGNACLLRAAAISEAYGARPGESNRLLDQSRLWQEQFQRALTSLKSLQEFGFPPGFALDQWDQKGS